jgi:hypothetical protein
MDLEASPDAKGMLEDAVHAAGNTQAELVVPSLRESCSAVALKIRKNRMLFRKRTSHSPLWPLEGALDARAGIFFRFEFHSVLSFLCGIFDIELGSG